MNGRIDDEALLLVLGDERPDGDPELERAAARAAADLEQIRIGLRLVAEELPVPAAVRQTRRRPSRRVVALAVGLAATAVAVILAVASGGGGGRTAAPRFLPDSFRYQAAPALSAGGLFGGGRPAPPYSVPYLSDVSASSASSAWTVGSTAEGRSVAWHWDGSAWRSTPLPTVSDQLNLTSVAAVDDGEAWAVGWQMRPIDRLNYDTHAVIEHWDGAGWRMVPAPYAGQSSLLSVTASGPRDVWAVGQIFHDSKETAKDVEHGKFPAHHDRLLLLHWDGASWSVATPAWGRPPHGIVPDAKVVTSGPEDVWVISSGLESDATGPDGKTVREITPAQIEHWNGKNWQAVPLPFGPMDPPSGFSAISPADAWAVGSYRKAGHSFTLAAHWDGRSWQIAPTPSRSVDSILSNVVAVSPDDVWAVGESQWLKVAGKDTTSKAPVALFEHWDGRSWRVMAGVTPVIDGALAISATHDGTAWAVGSCVYDNVIAHWSGGAWQISPHPPDKFPPNRPGSGLTCSSPEVG
jgi:hypothetical protein